jgi:post-GPI attachment to proteins factor 3
MDYFSAMLGLLSAVFYALHRTLGIKLLSFINVFVSVVFTTFFLGHISYLSYFRFDYGYNMKASITVAILNCSIWLIWATFNRKRMPHAWKISVTVLCLLGASLFEVFDFSPLLGIIDAHSLWHAFTIPCVTMYWDFLLEDSQYQVREGKIQ